MSEAEEKAKIRALLGAGPKKLHDPSKTDRGSPPSAPTAIAVTGVAKDAKLGAVVVTPKGTYYIDGLSGWPDNVLGKNVAVNGRLNRRKLAPDPRTGPNGEVSAGAAGTQSVIEQPKWQVLPK